MSTSPIETAVGTFGAPPDGVATSALGAAVLLMTLASFRRGRSILGVGSEPIPRRAFLAVTGFSAALLSLGYVAFYLRGGPRIVDATMYFLQGRALSEGSFSWSVLEPTSSFRGRFLLFRDGVGSIGGIFPPGYPLLLALGFGIGAPMIVGPLLGAAIVIATYRLAHRVAQDLPKESAEMVARTAALLSLSCAALRYHTADTMAHGAAALGVAIALERALTARREGSRGAAAACGLALGFVAATRPVTTLAIAIVALTLLRRAERRSLAVCAGFALPGMFLLLLGQHAVTGEWFTSSQRAYYATADGPPGCFRWGLGAGIGCVHEHGEFVAARLPSGYGVLEAVATTARRLKPHVLDVANLELLAPLCLLPILRRRDEGVRAGTALVVLHVLAYAPFYFDGNYPGGGARLFADVLPVEHVLVATALSVAFRSQALVVTASFALLSASMLGFAVHGAFEHQKLAARDGGRPMFEPDLLARSSVKNGLVFVETDHGFALGHDPAARADRGVVVARVRNDARDWFLYEALDRPPSYLYRFTIGLDGAAAPELLPWTPPDPGTTLRLEAEAEWPALQQRDGFAAPVWTLDCASGSRALTLTPTTADKTASVTLALPIRDRGRYILIPRIVHGARMPFSKPASNEPPEGRLELEGVKDSDWHWTEIKGAGCQELFARELDLAPPGPRLRLSARRGAATLDAVTLERLP
jgi:hypothetical protein